MSAHFAEVAQLRSFDESVDGSKFGSGIPSSLLRWAGMATCIDLFRRGLCDQYVYPPAADDDQEACHVVREIVVRQTRTEKNGGAVVGDGRVIL